MVQAIITISSSDADGMKYNQCLHHAIHSLSTVLHVGFLSWSPGRDVVVEMRWVEKYFQREDLQGHATSAAPSEPHHNSQE